MSVFGGRGCNDVGWWVIGACRQINPCGGSRRGEGRMQKDWVGGWVGGWLSGWVGLVVPWGKPENL